jgi:hypothetical protein
MYNKRVKNCFPNNFFLVHFFNSSGDREEIPNSGKSNNKIQNILRSKTT